MEEPVGLGVCKFKIDCVILATFHISFLQISVDAYMHALFLNGNWQYIILHSLRAFSSYAAFVNFHDEVAKEH